MDILFIAVYLINSYSQLFHLQNHVAAHAYLISNWKMDNTYASEYVESEDVSSSDGGDYAMEERDVEIEMVELRAVQVIERNGTTSIVEEIHQKRVVPAKILELTLVFQGTDEPVDGNIGCLAEEVDKKDLFLTNVREFCLEFSQMDGNGIIHYSCAIDSFVVSFLHALRNLDVETRDIILGLDVKNDDRHEMLSGLDKLALDVEYDLGKHNELIGEYPKPYARDRGDCNEGTFFENAFYCRTFDGYNPLHSREDMKENARRNIRKGRNYVGVLMNFMRYYYALKEHCLADCERAMMWGHPNNDPQLSENRRNHLEGFSTVRYFWIYYYHLSLQMEKAVRYYSKVNGTNDIPRGADHYGTPEFKTPACSYERSVPYYYPTTTCIYSKNFYATLVITRKMTNNASNFNGAFDGFNFNQQPGYLNKLDRVLSITRLRKDKTAPVRKILTMMMSENPKHSTLLEKTAKTRPWDDRPAFSVNHDLIAYPFYHIVETTEGQHRCVEYIVRGVSKNFLENYVLAQYESIGKVFQLMNDVVGSAIFYWSMEDLVHPITKKKYRPISITVNVDNGHFISLLRHCMTDAQNEITSEYWHEYDNVRKEYSWVKLADGYEKIRRHYTSTTHLDCTETENNKQAIVIKDTSLFKKYATIAKKPFGELLDTQKAWTPGHSQGTINTSYQLTSIFYVQVI